MQNMSCLAIHIDPKHVFETHHNSKISPLKPQKISILNKKKLNEKKTYQLIVVYLQEQTLDKNFNYIQTSTNVKKRS